MSGRACAPSHRDRMVRANATLSRYPRVMALAQRIEPDTNRLARWWLDTPIEEFARMTPDELASTGRSDLVERFLQSILRSERD